MTCGGVLPTWQVFGIYRFCMRIAHIIDDLGCGGAEQMVASLAAWQSHKSHLVLVICLRDVGANPVNIDELREAGVEIVTLGKPPGFHLATLQKLKARLEHDRIEVLHTHNHLVHHYGVAAGRLARVPVILNTLHGIASLQTSASWTKALFWCSCLLSDRLVCVDDKVRHAFRENYCFPIRKLGIVRNGADLKRFLSLTRRAPGNTLTFGSIGRLEPVKGYSTLLRAFAVLHREDSRVRLRLLGDGTLRTDLQALAKNLSISNAVSFEGFSLDTPSFLAGIDIYVLSSLSEGLPLTLLEAMAAGLPIVATAVGGVPELIERSKCGWLCLPGDPEALAETMRMAIAAPDPRAIGALGRRFVAESYSVERMADDYDNLYRALLA